MWYPANAEFFSRHKASSGGLYPNCKVCKKLYAREERVRNKETHQVRAKAYYQANAEQVKAKRREYYEQNRESVLRSQETYRAQNKEKVSQGKMRAKKAKPEKYKAMEVRYREKNRFAINQRLREWNARNKDKVRVWTRNAQAKRKAVPGSYSLSEIKQMYADQGGLCAYCEGELNGTYHVDHMLPISRGGTNDWTNLAITCVNCNQRKWTKTTEEFFNRE